MADAVESAGTPTHRVAHVLDRRREQIAQQWADLPLFRAVFTVARDEAIEACHAVLGSLVAVAGAERSDQIEAPEFDSIREQLTRMTQSRARAGLSVGQVDREVAALAEAVTGAVEQELASSSAEEVHVTRTSAVMLMATLRLVAMETMLNEGQEIIARQRQQLLEMSTPVIKLWDRVVAVPLIGMLDSARSQVVMENLLEAIVEHNANLAILDITGVPTVDTLVAHHLMKTVASARLMGAECVISGIRPAIAQTIVQLGIDLGHVVTRATLAEALALALSHEGVQGASGTAPHETGYVRHGNA